MRCLRRIVLSGCSGGGKSTLLAELSRRGFATFPEPGRRIVQQELATGGSALPWADMTTFLSRCIELAKADYATMVEGTAFYDRSAVDAVAAARRLGLTLPDELANAARERRYDSPVFLTPPWPELFEKDAERQHDFAAALTEYDDLCRSYPANGYRTIEVPRAPVPERVDFIISQLEGRDQGNSGSC